jgi:hypothetical protein
MQLLLLEELAMSLRVFSLIDPIPTFQLSDIPRSSVQRVVVKPEVRSSLQSVSFNSEMAFCWSDWFTVY